MNRFERAVAEAKEQVENLLDATFEGEELDRHIDRLLRMETPVSDFAMAMELEPEAMVQALCEHRDEHLAFHNHNHN